MSVLKMPNALFVKNIFKICGLVFDCFFIDFFMEDNSQLSDEINEGQQVELAQQTKATEYWVDSSRPSMFLYFSLYLFFLLVEVWMIFSAPQSIISKEEMINAITPQSGPYAFEIFISIDKIQSTNKFITISSSILKKNKDVSDLYLKLDSIINFNSKGFTKKTSSNIFERNIHFKENEDFSEVFPFFNQALTSNIKSIDIQVHITSENESSIKSIAGMKFIYTFSNSAAIKYQEYAKFFFSLTLAIIFIFYILTTKIENIHALEIMCIIFAVSGILSGIPFMFSYWFAFWFALFLFSFRLFIVNDFYSTGINQTISTLFLVSTSIFYIFGGIVFFIFVANNSLTTNKIQANTSSVINILFNSFEVINLLFMGFMAICSLIKTQCQSNQTIMSFFIFLLTEVSSIIFYVILPIFKPMAHLSNIPSLAQQIVFITSAEIVLNYLQPFQGFEYNNIDDENMKEDENIEIALQDSDESIESFQES